MKKRIGIGIPTVNRMDLLMPALLYYAIDFPDCDIFVVDNGNQGIPDMVNGKEITVIELENNIGVAASWNMLADAIFKAGNSHALILNDDIYLGKPQNELLNVIISEGPQFVMSMMDFCAFILPKETFQKVGRFDEQFFPAYCEDSDYLYRMRISGVRVSKWPMLMPAVYKCSSTLHKEPVKYHRANAENKARYAKKWGGEPGRETFLTPYKKK